MDSKYKIYLSRAQNELNLSNIITKISNDKELQVSIFKTNPDTYYSATISHSYYSIFYSAKAYLILKNIKTQAPEEHKKTFEEFSKFVKKGIIDFELLEIYKNMLIKADSLLSIFEFEKGKRGNFTYKKIPQANKEPAQESINNAKIFFNHLFNLCEKIAYKKQ